MKLKGIEGIALLAAAILLVIGSVAGLAVAAGGGDSGGNEEFEWNWDACYWWEALPTSPYHQQQAREVGILIFDRYFGIDISAMNWQELDELWDVIGHENQEEAERLFAQYATEKGFEIPGMPAPREEFVAPPDATYWWEFIDPELRDGAITMAKTEFPEMVRSYWELADWKGVELPIPRPEELCVMTLTLEEYEQILAPPSFPLGLVTIKEWYRRWFPHDKVIAVFGQVCPFTAPAEWMHRLHQANDLMGPLFHLLVDRHGVISMGITAVGYISVRLYCPQVMPQEAQAVAGEIYAMIAEKAETVGIKNIPVVFVLSASRWRSLTGAPETLLPRREDGSTLSSGSAYKDPRDHLGTCLPLDQGFRPVPGGAQTTIGTPGEYGTIGFPVRDPIPFWPDDEDITTTGHLGPGGTLLPINTPVYQPLPGSKVGTAAFASWDGWADVARVATSDGYVIPYVRTTTFWTAPVTGTRDPNPPE
ncbi:S1 family peptidase [Dehalococcoidia bacterium]|nr:S1 family peptidase [Dehalococcoidia bacterium]